MRNPGPLSPAVVAVVLLVGALLLPLLVAKFISLSGRGVGAAELGILYLMSISGAYVTWKRWGGRGQFTKNNG